MKTKLLTFLLFLLGTFNTKAQNELFCEDFELWTVGTAFIQDPHDSTNVVWADYYTPYPWNGMLDPNFDSLALYSGVGSFGLHGGLFPYEITSDSTALSMDLQGLLSITGLSYDLPAYDFNEKGRISFDYFHIFDTQGLDTITFSFSSDQESYLYYLINNSSVNQFVPHTFIIPELSASANYDTLKIEILKRSSVPNYNNFVMDNFCVEQNITTATHDLTKTKLNVYPTLISSDQKLSISFARKTKGILRIISSNGQLILSENVKTNTQELQIPASKLKTGINFIIYIDQAGSQLTNSVFKINN